MAGLRRKLEVAHTKLCASRAFWLTAYPGQGHEMLFDAHARAFGAFEGIPERGIYDNMKTAVDRVGRGKTRTINARFEAMTSHYLFEPEFCNVASGWEKGIVEKNVQDCRRQIWREAAELLQDERARMMPNPRPFDGYVELPARVSSTSLVHFERNRYSLPTCWGRRSRCAWSSFNGSGSVANGAPFLSAPGLLLDEIDVVTPVVDRLLALEEALVRGVLDEITSSSSSSSR